MTHHAPPIHQCMFTGSTELKRKTFTIKTPEIRRHRHSLKLLLIILDEVRGNVQMAYYSCSFTIRENLDSRA